jgi:hypothetical protein
MGVSGHPFSQLHLPIRIPPQCQIVFLSIRDEMVEDADQPAGKCIISYLGYDTC